MAREYLYLVKEQSFGVPAVPGSGDITYVKLSQSNAFSMNAAPVIGEISQGNGTNTTACFYSSQFAVTGTLQGELFPAYAKELLDWGITPINADRDEPWVTNSGAGLPVGDLGSMTCYHAYLLDDNESWVCNAYPGVKVTGGSITAGSSQLVWNFSLNLQGTSVSGMSVNDFEFPGDTDYPCGPYVYADLAGHLTVETSRSEFSQVTFTWANTISANYFESRYPKVLRYTGRGNGTTLAVNLLMKHSPDDEAAFQALTPQDVSLTLNNGTDYLTIDLGSNNIWSARTRDLAIDNAFLWNGTLRNGYDKSVGADIVITGGTV